MKKKVSIILVLLLFMSFMGGCGASNKSGEYVAPTTMEDNMKSGDSFSYQEMEAQEAAQENVDQGATAERAAGGEGLGKEPSVQEPVDSGRKLITTMSMSVQTENFDHLTSTVEKRVEEMEGYIEELQMHNQTNVSMTIRIPANKLTEFLKLLEEESNVISATKSVEDITLTYVDLDSHKKALKTEEKRLLELLEKAESMEDIFAIEGRLTDIRYQIQSMESQLRTYDNKVNYSTLYLDINEVERIVPVPEKSTWSRISTGFTENLYNLGVWFKELAIGILINLPFLVVWGIVIFIGVFVYRKVSKKRKKKKEQKANVPNHIDKADAPNHVEKG